MKEHFNELFVYQKDSHEGRFIVFVFVIIKVSLKLEFFVFNYEELSILFSYEKTNDYLVYDDGKHI